MTSEPGEAVHHVSGDPLLALLHEVYQSVHVRRFDHRDGQGRGPDSFYAGIVAAQGEVMAVAARCGYNEAQVYHGRSNPCPPF